MKKNWFGMWLCMFSIMLLKWVTISPADETGIADANSGSSAVNRSAFSNGIFSGAGSLQGGVNLFSGDFSTSLTLLNLEGRNGLNAAVTVSYSSNVHILMNTENKFFQNSWVGTGWALGLGTIKAELNGTKSLTDDVYYLISPNGGVAEIIKDSDGSYQLENSPYWKIVPTITSGKLVGWTLTDIGGIVYEYGDFVDGFGNKKANRCIRLWGDWIGNGVADGEEQICNEWDLSKIADVTGQNKIEIFYFQEQDLPVVNPADPTPTYYTRASYIDYLIDSAGRKIKFILGDRTTVEYSKKNLPFQIEQYETKYLDKIEVYENATASQPLSSFDFSYQIVGTGEKTKRQLTGIVPFNADSNALPGYIFGYAGPGEDNEGALKNITYPEGGTKTVKYKTQNNLYLTQQNDNIIQGAGANQQDEILFRFSGTTSAYIDKVDDELFILKWAGKWQSVAFVLSDINDDTRIAVSDNHVVLFRKGSTYTLDVYDWDRNFNTWIPQTLVSASPAKNGEVAVNESKLAFYTDENARVQTWKWGETERLWVPSGAFSITQFSTSEDWPVSIQVVDNALLVSSFVSNERLVYLWDGSTWPQSNYKDYSNSNSFYHVLMDEYFADYNTSTGQLSRYYFDGNNSVFHGMTDYSEKGIKVGRYSYAVFSDNHILVCEFKDGGGGNWPFVANIYVWDRHESGWSGHTLLKTISLANNQTELNNNEFTVNCSVNDQFIAVLKRTVIAGNPTLEGPILSWQWDAASLTWNEKTVPMSNYPRSPDTDVELSEVDFAVIGNHIVAHSPGREGVVGLPVLSGFTDTWDWNGNGWVGPTRIFSSHSYRYRLFGGYNYIGAYRKKNGEIKAAIVHGLNNWTNNVVDYPVEYIAENDGYASQAIKTNYDFSTVNYEPFVNLAGYETAKITPEGNYGHTEYTFNEEITGDIRDRGVPTSIKSFKENNTTNPITANIMFWEIYEHTGSAYRIRLSSDHTTSDDITTSIIYFYNDGSNGNGLPNKITETNTDGSNRITVIDYAYQQPEYSGMSTKNMLAQVAQRTTYLNDETNAANARTSTATTYKEWPAASGKWAPEASYAWLEANPGSYSLPSFDFNNPGSDPEWVQTSKINTRNSYGQVEEAQDINATVSTTKWGHRSLVPAAAIVNATDSETLVDGFDEYSSSSDPLFAGRWFEYYSSGSVAGYTTITADGAVKFENTSYSNWKGLRRNLSSTMTNLIFECDVASSSPTDAFYVSVRNNSTGYVAITKFGSDGYFHAYSNGAWSSALLPYQTGVPYHVRMVIDTPADQWYVYIDGAEYGPFSCTAAGGVDYIAYFDHKNAGYSVIDNVRVYPADAYCSSIAYDRTDLKVLQTIDGNGISGSPDYDEFNRTVGVRNEQKELLTATAISDHAFTAAAPNFVESVSFPNGNYAVNWSFELPEDTPSNDEKWGSYYQGVLTWVDAGVVQPYLGSYSLKIDDNDTDSTPDGASFNFYNGENNRVDAEEYHRLVGQPVTFSAWVRTAGGTKTIRIGIEANTYQTYSVGTTWQRISAHFDNLNYNEPSPTANYAKRLRCNITLDGSQTGTFYIDGVALEVSSSSVPAEFLVSTTYADGLGRTLQTQTRNSVNDIVGHLTYNELGKVQYTYEPFEQNTGHLYLPASSLPAGLSKTESSYEDSPLARIDLFTPLGNTAPNSVDYEFGSATPLSSTNAHHFVRLKDENNPLYPNRAGVRYFDKFGNLVETVTAEGSTKEIKAQYNYDILGNLETITDPNGFTSTNTYDTFGRALTVATPDEGTTKYIYDNAGRLRYAQNENQRTGNHFMVYEYDLLNRLTQEGVEKDESFDWVNTFPPVTTTYATDPDEWRVKLYYDADYVSAGANFTYGRLTKTETNDDNENNPEHITQYVYDRYGRITQKTVIIDEGNNLPQQTISHQYDKLGREILKIYPSGLTVSQSYDAVGRLKIVSVIE